MCVGGVAGGVVSAGGVSVGGVSAGGDEGGAGFGGCAMTILESWAVRFFSRGFVVGRAFFPNLAARISCTVLGAGRKFWKIFERSLRTTAKILWMRRRITHILLRCMFSSVGFGALGDLRSGFWCVGGLAGLVLVMW